MHGIVHLAARLAGHATQCQVLNGGSKTVAGMPLDMGKVDQESRILDKPGYFPAPDVFVGPFMFVIVFLVRPGGGIHRAA